MGTFVKILGLLLFVFSFLSCSGFNYDNLAKEEIYKRKEAKLNKIFETKTNLELPLRIFGRDFAYIQPKSYIIGVYPIYNETKARRIPSTIQRIILTATSKLLSSPIAFYKIKFVNVNFFKDEYYLAKFRANYIPPNINFSIEGSITEFDRIVETYNDFNGDITVGGGITTTDGGLSFNKSTGITILTLDLNFLSKRENLVIPLGYTSNSLILTRKGKGNAFYLYIWGNGITLGRDIYITSSVSLGIRFLTEFSLIQLLGRVDTLPYWHCLKDKNIKDKVLLDYMKEEWNRLTEERKLLRYSKVAKLYFGYYIAKNLPENVRSKVSFDIKTKEGIENTKKLIQLIKKFYKLDKTSFFDYNSYLYIWEKAPFCSYPYNKKLDTFLKEKVNINTFKLSNKKNPIMSIILDWNMNK